MQQLYQLSLHELVAGVRENRWTAGEATRAFLERIAALEPTVQAWEHLQPDDALARAKRLDVAALRGPLQGAPIAIKDIIDVAGMPSRYGSPVYASAAPAAESAECVTALEHAGAIVLGKSVTTEFAYYTPRKTRNPWNPRHTPGGSSMGSAAAVACGMAVGALGTQTNGSVIRPAAFCGIVGFKPSLGAVSNHGTLDPWPTLDHTGVFSRDVAGAALLACSIALPGQLSGSIAQLARAPRLAVVRSPVWDLAQHSQREMLVANASTLAQAGAQVDELELPPAFGDAHRIHRIILAYEGARHFCELQRRHRADMSTRFNELLDEGATIAEPEYRAALSATQALRTDFRRILEAYDALITPPATGEAPATLEETGSPVFCTMWTLLGAPAITIPVGLGPSGLPLGLQIVGRQGEDDRTLNIAAWCEKHIPFAGLRLRRQAPISE
jgi:Asp-tRNA(Asn)/Glu-tRNA(Gln) amidotransferase A subunit family amidase